MKRNIEKTKLSYSFLKNMCDNKQPFTVDDISNATGWSNTTTKTYIGKKWKGLLSKNKNSFTVDSHNFQYSEAEYIRMMSQVNEYSSNPYKPELSENTEMLIVKAKESGILAIDIYNRPMTSFRSQGFIVMMIIAWTSLLHAIFENEGIDYYYKKNGSIDKIDGDKKAWELSKCIEQYTGIPQAVKENIKMFIILRNKIEHRYSPLFDLDICGECQALLNNFEELITSRFGSYYSLGNTLTIPLQVLSSRPSWQTDTARQFQSKHYKELKSFIDTYRRGLSDEIYSDMKYSFRVYLIPKNGNHYSSSDTAIEFVKYDPSQPDLFEKLEKDITLIKEKRVQVANQGRFKPKDVCSVVSKQIDKKFSISNHTQAWKFYEVRKKGQQPDGCNTVYCQYDEPHQDYIYTQAWVDFLIDKLSDEDEYKHVLSFK